MRVIRFQPIQKRLLLLLFRISLGLALGIGLHINDHRHRVLQSNSFLGFHCSQSHRNTLGHSGPRLALKTSLLFCRQQHKVSLCVCMQLGKLLHAPHAAQLQSRALGHHSLPVGAHLLAQGNLFPHCFCNLCILRMLLSHSCEKKQTNSPMVSRANLIHPFQKCVSTIFNI